MSIAVLTQVYDEMRRLAIAGSATAGGDFRLKKLIPSLEQAGVKAPVFAKVAHAVKALVEATEQSSASAMLDLSTLVNAILYTQGETGIDGALAEIETNDLGPQTSQVSASVLKPVLEALTTTGSGRLEIIRDSFERGAFRDLRLVKSALDAIDDSRPDVGDFVAKNVLPLYGKAILPELKSHFDLKSSKAGHLHRLSLMRQLDSEGTREIVKQALDDGSKEIKIAAIECLGDAPEDLAFLLEQSSAKKKDIRRAALKALAELDSDAVIETFQKAIVGADLDIAIQPIQQNKSLRLLKFVIEEAEKQLEAVFGIKNTWTQRTELGEGVGRLYDLLSCLEGHNDTTTEEFLVKLFQRHEEILRLKGGPGGAAINKRVAELMGVGSKRVQKMLANAHATLSPDILFIAFSAARKSMKPTEAFGAFSAYLLAKVDDKKKALDPAWAKRTAIIQAITAPSIPRHSLDELNKIYEDGTWDPRWLDVAVEIGDGELTCCLARSTHEGCKKLLSKLWREWYEARASSSSVSLRHVDILKTMIRIEHPDAVPNLVETIKKYDSNKSQSISYAFHLGLIGDLIPELPETAIAPLETLLPTLRGQTADYLLSYMTTLKNKP